MKIWIMIKELLEWIFGWKEGPDKVFPAPKEPLPLPQEEKSNKYNPLSSEETGWVPIRSLSKEPTSVLVPTVAIMGVPLVSELVRVNQPEIVTKVEFSPSTTSTVVPTEPIVIATPFLVEPIVQVSSSWKITIDPFEVENKTLPDLEVWVDDAQVKILKPEYWDVVKDLGFKSAAFMVDTSTRGWDTSWTAKKYEKVGKLAADRGIKLITTIWPEPNKLYFNGALKDIANFLNAAGSHILESDMEFNWKPERSTFKTWIEANDEFLKFIDKVKQQVPNLQTELTTFTSHAENGKAAKAAPHMDRLVVQAYGIRRRPNGDLIPWGHVYSAGKMQTYTLDRTILVPGVQNGKPRVSVGVPAWDQEWPGHTEKEAMQLARDACLNYPHVQVESLRYWSSKWIFGSRKNDYASDFIKGLK